jgi:hypothetical protein
VARREEENAPCTQIRPRGELNRLVAVVLTALAEELGVAVQRVGPKLAEAFIDALEESREALALHPLSFAALLARLARRDREVGERLVVPF